MLMGRRAVGLFPIIAVAIALWSLQALSRQGAPSVTRSWFTPAVIPETYSDVIRFEATISGNPASVGFEYDGVDRPMFNDGTNGDLVPGDATWTIQFQPAEILSKATPQWVHRPFIGFCEPSGTTARQNVFAEVWTADVGLADVRQIDPTTQETDHVVNIVAFANETQTGTHTHWAQRFYQYYRDRFDFLNFVYTGAVQRTGNRFHSGVKNTISGIGLSMTDSTAVYGSRGGLLGISVFPLTGLWDGAGTGFNHETGHQWIAFIPGSLFTQGRPHWPKGSMAGNIMGFSIGGAGGQGGTYPFAFTPFGAGYLVSSASNVSQTTFNTLELYLMGLAAPEEVGTNFVLNNQNQNVTPGQVLQASDVTLFDINTVIASAGPRVPDSTVSQKAFRTATLLLSEQPLDVYAMSLYEWFARRAEGTDPVLCSSGFASNATCRPFFAATSGRATMSMALGSARFTQAQYDATLAAPRCAAIGDSCESGGSLIGRHGIPGGPEPHQPNTIFSACADGQGGTFHTDQSIDHVSVSTADGSVFAEGKTVTIAASAWIANTASDRVDLYHTSHALNPVWTLAATLTPTATGMQSFSAAYVLPSGATQAVRAQLRSGGSVSPCATGPTDDQDDLVFAVVPPDGLELVTNGTFAAGLSNWFLHEVPDIVHNNAANGRFEYHKANPTTTGSGQAVIFQNTGVSVGSGTGLTAQFDIGNTDTVRKRISVLIIDADFSDLSVCTFWLAPSVPLTTYQMKMHPTKDWANAAIYFYAASGSATGDYLLDNVSLEVDGTASGTRTECIDPARPALPSGVPGPDMLGNGDFSSPTLPPWGPFFDITHQVTGGVFEFIRPGTPGVPAGGILQATNQALTSGQIITATFQLGNSSAVRKRVTILLHDLDFSDLSACTFWIAPGQALSNFALRTYATKAWTNATLSVYAATSGLEQWTRLDNVTLARTPNPGVFLGTECFEPGSSPEPSEGLPPGLKTRPSSGFTPPSGFTSPFGFTSTPGDSGADPKWRAAATTTGRAVLGWPAPIDLTGATSATLTFESWLTSRASSAEVQVSLDGVTWETVATLSPSDGWTTVNVDLDAFVGRQIYVRFIFDAVAPALGVAPDVWRIQGIQYVGRTEVRSALLPH